MTGLWHSQIRCFSHSFDFDKQREDSLALIVYKCLKLECTAIRNSRWIKGPSKVWSFGSRTYNQVTQVALVPRVAVIAVDKLFKLILVWPVSATFESDLPQIIQNFFSLQSFLQSELLLLNLVPQFGYISSQFKVLVLDPLNSTAFGIATVILLGLAHEVS